MEPGDRHCWGPGMEAAFRAYLLTHRCVHTTAASYVRNVRYFAHWCEAREIQITQASREAVAIYITELLDSSLAHNTVPLRLSCIRAFYKFCRVQAWRIDDPTQDQSVKWEDPPPKIPYDKEDVRALLEGCRTPRDRAMILLAYDCGLRVSEVLGIRAPHIDTKRQVIFVKGKGSKYRWIPVSAETIESLQSLMGLPNGILWWTKRGPLSVKCAQNYMVRIARRAGVTGAHWHRLRTTFANECLDAGVDIEDLQDLMGHAQVSTTIRYGKHTIHKRAHEALRRLNRVALLGG
jgi:integrase/recombinase XerD